MIFGLNQSSQQIKTMLKNHILVALRDMWRHKFFSFLNVLGLAIGLSAFLMIFLYLKDETSYDQFHQDRERIYRVTQTNIWAEEPHRLDALGPAASAALLQDIPEVEVVTRIHPEGDFLVFSEDQPDQTFDEKQILAVDSNFFQIFDFPMLRGATNQALKLPYSIVLTNSAARRYFGGEDAVGKRLTLSNGAYEEVFEVRGILADVPTHSHIQFDMLISMNSLPLVEERSWSWIWTTFVTYIKAKQNTSLEALNSKLAKVPAQNVGASIQKLFGDSYQRFGKNAEKWHLYAEPLDGVYLHSEESGNRIGPKGDIRYIYVFSAIALLIILLSCINFVNLSTARSFQRAKEVGVRKVLGSGRKALVFQFLREACLYGLMATTLALVLTEICLLPFNRLVDKSLSLLTFVHFQLIIPLLLLPFIVGILAGVYPAFYLTRFQPTRVLKGQINMGSRGRFSRDFLVFLQFSVSILLIISSLILYRQLNYWQQKKLGFDSSGLIVISKVERLGAQQETFRKKILKHSHIIAAGTSDTSPPFIWNQDYFQASPQSNSVPFSCLVVDDYYLSTLDFNMQVGQSFSPEQMADSDQVILNQKGLEVLGWKAEEALGKNLIHYGQSFRVMGVVEDFHYASLQFPIGPLAIFHFGADVFTNSHHLMTVRTGQASQLPLVLKHIENVWQELAPHLPLEYNFLDRIYAMTYREEQKTGKILTIFTGLALFIATLGLIGLATFSARSRVKEIGIRKVMGASVWQIFILLSREYLRIIVLSFLVAAPLAYWIMRQWLQDFAYRIEIGWGSFFWASLTVIIVALLAISYQALRAALINPAHSLRNE